MEFMRRRGRPKKDAEDVKVHLVKVRMKDGDLKELDDIAKWAKMSRSETIRTLIHEAKNIYNSEDEKSE